MWMPKTTNERKGKKDFLVLICDLDSSIFIEVRGHLRSGHFLVQGALSLNSMNLCLMFYIRCHIIPSNFERHHFPRL
jgi:hypothetical protein